MKDDFYTCGGGYFWEDVFFYQKWRIQRNYVSKKCRLLDNWDIRRHEGSFEECRQAFIKYIEAYEIARQKGHMIIMIHSLGQTKNIFKPLWRLAIKNNFMAAAVNYPSSQKDIESHAKQFHFFLNHLEDVDTVSFVSLGTGNLILQKLFSEKAKWQKKLKIARAVEVAPCLNGNNLLAFLAKFKLFAFLLGPTATELSEDKIAKINFKSNIETGVVLTNKSFFEKLLEFIFHKTTPKLSISDAKTISGACDIKYIGSRRINVFDTPDICEACVKFLKLGKF